MKFKVGQVLTVIPLEEVKKRKKSEYGNYEFDGKTMVSDMLKYCGEKVTVERLFGNGKMCYIKEENYGWTHDMFEEDKEEEKKMNLELDNLTEEQKNQIIELAKKFEQENEVDKLDYYHDWKVYSSGVEANEVCMVNVELAKDLFKLGLTAHTKQEATKIRNRLLVEKELRDWAKKCKEPANLKDDGQIKHVLAYNIDSDNVSCDYFYDYVYANIVFTEEAVIKQAIKEIGQERLIRDYFGIDSTSTTATGRRWIK